MITLWHRVARWTAVVAGLFLFFGTSIPSAGAVAYCWCVTPQGLCESHTQNDGDGTFPLVCSPSTPNNINCSEYCYSRNQKYGQQGWFAAHCDVDQYYDRKGMKYDAQKKECPIQDPKVTQQNTKVGSSTNIDDPLKGVTIQGLIARFIKAVIGIVGALALLFFVYGGFLYMWGTDDSVKKAKSIMKNSLFGLVLIFLSYMIVNIFFGFFSLIGA